MANITRFRPTGDALDYLFRVFSLAQDVDEGAAQAKYNDGVLELTLPKKKAAATRKLVIQ